MEGRTLNAKEELLLQATEYGQLEVVEELLGEPDTELDVNCVDSMGRNVLIHGIRCEALELLDLLLSHPRTAFNTIEEALLHATATGRTHIVKLIIDHPAYITGERTQSLIRSRLGAVHRSQERSQFSPDITPMMVAAHNNNYEMIELFHNRRFRIEPPHPDVCSCLECKVQREDDSLMMERSRLNAYRALASPAFIVATTQDPVADAFELAQCLKSLAKNHKEFKEDYMALAEQCMQFAIEMLHLCRSAKEVEVLLSRPVNIEGHELIDPLAYIKLGLQCNEKKFISHPNCQMLCRKYFFRDLAFLSQLSGLNKILVSLVSMPLLPFFCLLYIIYPDLEVGRVMDCPVVKFATASLSYACLLAMLILTATRPSKDERAQHLDENDNVKADNMWPQRALGLYDHDFRHNHIAGMLWMEMLEIYSMGASSYVKSFYNMIDTVSMAFYIISFVLQGVVWIKVQNATSVFASKLDECKSIIQNSSVFFKPMNSSDGKFYSSGLERYQQLRYEMLMYNNTYSYGYWLRGNRQWWDQSDPSTVAECAFSVAAWISFVRITYILCAWEVVGPLQISLGRMITNIIRFMCIFGLFLLGFCVSLANLYWYWSDYIEEIVPGNKPDNFKVKIKEKERKKLGGMLETFTNLYWTLFGIRDDEEMAIIKPNTSYTTYYKAEETYTIEGSLDLMNGVGCVMLGAYCMIMIIMLINMLIAMMSQTYEFIQNAADYEWKFARCQLWMWYLEQEHCLPVPFNLLPSLPLASVFKMIRRLGGDKWGSGKKLPQDSYTLSVAIRQSIMRPATKKLQYAQMPESFGDALLKAPLKAGNRASAADADIVIKLRQRLRRRYLFKMMREHEESSVLRSLQSAAQAAERSAIKQVGSEVDSPGEAVSKKNISGSGQGPPGPSIDKPPLGWAMPSTPGPGLSPATVRRPGKHPLKKADSVGEAILQGSKTSDIKSSEKLSEAEEKRQSPRPIGFRTSITERSDNVSGAKPSHLVALASTAAEAPSGENTPRFVTPSPGRDGSEHYAGPKHSESTNTFRTPPSDMAPGAGAHPLCPYPIEPSYPMPDLPSSPPPAETPPESSTKAPPHSVSSSVTLPKISITSKTTPTTSTSTASPASTLSGIAAKQNFFSKQHPPYPPYPPYPPSNPSSGPSSGTDSATASPPSSIAALKQPGRQGGPGTGKPSGAVLVNIDEHQEHKGDKVAKGKSIRDKEPQAHPHHSSMHLNVLRPFALWPSHKEGHSSGQAESEKESEGSVRMKSSSPGSTSTGSVRQHRMAPRHVTIKNSIQRLLMPVAMREQFLEEGALPEEEITSLGSQGADIFSKLPFAGFAALAFSDISPMSTPGSIVHTTTTTTVTTTMNENETGPSRKQASPSVLSSFGANGSPLQQPGRPAQSTIVPAATTAAAMSPGRSSSGSHVVEAEIEPYQHSPVVLRRPQEGGGILRHLTKLQSGGLKTGTSKDSMASAGSTAQKTSGGPPVAAISEIE